MKNSGPDLHMLNLVVDDMRASLDFYRQLGIAVPDGADAAAPHVQLRMPGGFSLELDTAESARLWHRRLLGCALRDRGRSRRQ